MSPGLRRRGLLGLGLAVTLPAQAQALPPVVASFSILGDFVRQIAGEKVALRVLLGPEAEPHDFAPRPSDAVAVRDAALLVRNGLNLEPWLDRLMRSAPPRGRVVTASEGITPRQGERGPDPHAWLDPRLAQQYARNIGAGLAAVLPAVQVEIEAATAAYIARLEALDAWAAQQLAAVPPERRIFAVGHAGFGYLAARYGLEMLAPQRAYGGQVAAGFVAELIREVRARQLRALFSTGPEDLGLMQRVAAEAGVTLAGRLYAETLSPPDGPAPSYEALTRHNIGLLVSAMLA